LVPGADKALEQLSVALRPGRRRTHQLAQVDKHVGWLSAGHVAVTPALLLVPERYCIQTGIDSRNLSQTDGFGRLDSSQAYVDGYAHVNQLAGELNGTERAPGLVQRLPGWGQGSWQQLRRRVSQS